MFNHFSWLATWKLCCIRSLSTPNYNYNYTCNSNSSTSSLFPRGLPIRALWWYWWWRPNRRSEWWGVPGSMCYSGRLHLLLLLAWWRMPPHHGQCHPCKVQWSHSWSKRRCRMFQDVEYTKPRRGSKWKIKMHSLELGSLGPQKPIPERIFFPSLCLLWAQNL